MVLEILASAIRPKKKKKKKKEKKKGIQTWKEEIKLLLFADNMIVYAENSKGSAIDALEVQQNLSIQDKYIKIHWPSI